MFFETSAKKGDNVNNAFVGMARKLMEKKRDSGHPHVAHEDAHAHAQTETHTRTRTRAHMWHMIFERPMQHYNQPLPLAPALLSPIPSFSSHASHPRRPLFLAPLLQ